MMIRNLENTQIGFDEIDEEYSRFVDKFKPKKTTDDCYTPQNIYEAVKDWVVKEYKIDESKIIRPFYPGGDYEREDYSGGKIVVDNPPFSILSQICSRYMTSGVKFFLFAPALTIFSVASGRTDITRLTTGANIEYENGATVLTSFVTNMDSVLIRTAPDLRKVIEIENDKNRQEKTKKMPKYDYPVEVMTASVGQLCSKYGIDLRIERNEALFVRGLDDQKQSGTGIFGSGYLLSEKAAAEKAAAEKAAAEKAAAEKAAAEKAAARKWKLSEREIQAIKSLGGVHGKN